MNKPANQGLQQLLEATDRQRHAGYYIDPATGEALPNRVDGIDSKRADLRLIAGSLAVTEQIAKQVELSDRTQDSQDD